jgi:hypothetical protein
MVVLVANIACGRVGFDRIGDGGPLDVEPISEVTTGDDQDDPSLPDDMLELFFNRYSPTASEILVARRASVTEPWGAPEVVQELVSPELDSNPEVSRDGLTMVFTSRRQGSAILSLWISTRASRSSPWSPPILVVDPPVNGTSADGALVMDAAGLALAFQSTRIDDEYDIFVASRPTTSDPWGPLRRVAELDTGMREESPFLDASGLTLYYETGGDLFYATRATHDDLFGEPAAIAELNTAGFEHDPWLSSDGRTLFFSRDDDLYMATR